MTIKLIATDMDGTFLDEKGTYDRLRFERLLKEMKAGAFTLWLPAATVCPASTVSLRDLRKK